jgi:alpha-ribazole phosphatase/probable phosphoglycerate mutase
LGVEIIFETHSVSLDNELGVATGWLHGSLSEAGKRLAKELGKRRRRDNIGAVFTSDLGRAVETAHIAFGGTDVPIYLEPRLRECNYGTMNGLLRAQLDDEGPRGIDEQYPEGESWRQAVERVTGFLGELAHAHDGQRVLIIGHMATWYALECAANSRALEDVFYAPFDWKEGWKYVLPTE